MTQKQLFEKWSDEQRSAQALADLSAWHINGMPDIEGFAKNHPDAFELYRIRLVEQFANEGKRGEHHLVTARYEHERTIEVNKLLRTGKWRIANIAAPIGCGQATSTLERSPVNIERERTESWFWAVVERV